MPAPNPFEEIQPAVTAQGMVTSCASLKAKTFWVRSAQSFNLISMLKCQLFVPGLRGNPQVFLTYQAPASPAVLGPSYTPFQTALSQNMTRAEQKGALSSLVQGALAVMAQINVTLQLLRGTDRKILNSFSFPANCSHLLPQFWLDSPFPLSSASTTRLSPPHPSPPSPRTSKVITIMN